MKLAILGSRGIPASYGGFETFAEELSTRLAQKYKIDVTVYCEERGKKKDNNYNGVKLIHIKTPSWGPLSTLIYDLKCLWHARRKFNIIYMLGYGSAILYFIPLFYGQNIWVNMDGIEWARSKWSPLAKLWFKIMEAVAVHLSSHIIADAEAIYRYLKKRYSYMSPCTVIEYGANLFDEPPSIELLKEWLITPKRYFLIVCRLEPENHVLEILKGFSQSKNNCDMVVVGDISKKTKYIKNLLNIKDKRIKFIGPIYDKQKLYSLRYYATAYFHGHSVGGTNPSLVEALSCGNIIVAHDNEFNKEVLGNIGYYFKTSNDIPKIIDKIYKMTDDIRKKVRHDAQNIVKEKYNWDIITEKYINLINSKNYS